MGKSSVNGPFSIAMLNYQRVNDEVQKIANICGFHGLKLDAYSTHTHTRARTDACLVEDHQNRWIFG